MLNVNLKNATERKKLMLVPSIIIIAALIGNIVRIHVSAFAEWVPLISVAITSVIAVALFHIINDKFTPAKNLILNLLYFIATFVILITIYQATHALWKASPTHFTALLAISLTIMMALAITKCSKLHMQSLPTHDIYKLLSLIILAFSTLNLCGLFELTNWTHFTTILSLKRVFAISTYFTCSVCVLFLVFGCYHNRQTTTSDNIISRYYKQLLIIALLLIALFLSFRYDTLINSPPSFYHWEYFVGPIRTIRNGGWLLWDTPSQYGFLNILLPSILPIKSSWHALYIFQGLLLLLAFLMLFNIACTKCDRYSKILISFLITASALYFADPDLIGPYLYPSSSVVRFFWCYIFLYLLHLYNKNTINLKKFALLGGSAWVVAVLWSAESAIYSSLTFYPAFFVAVLQQRQNTKISLCYILFPIFILTITIICISLYYHHFLHHLPDWINFIMYGFYYASGFGSVPMQPHGSVWILMLLFIGSINLLANISKNNLYDRRIVAIIGIAGCLLGIASYFVGRAVPQNITAMLPILVTIAFSLLNLSQAKAETFYLLAKVLTIPVFLIALITTISNRDFITKIHNFRSFSSDLTQILPQADQELQQIMQKAKITLNAPIAYHSYGGGFPMVKENTTFKASEITWLPNPLLLLEEPIPEQRKQLIINRFMNRIHRSGFLIQANGSADDRFKSWVNLINQYCIQEDKIANKSYTAIYFNCRE